MKRRVIEVAGLGALVIALAIVACTKGSVAVPEAAPQAPTAKFRLIAAGDHHMLLSSTAGSTASVCVLDWGEGTRPSIDVNAPVQHFQLDHDGQDLLVVSGGKATLRFSVRNDAGSVNGETVVPVIGISDIGDAVGFDTRVLAHAADGDGFDRVRKARLSVDHGKEKISGIPGPYRPEKQCCSGGTGSTSCSSHGQTNSCSVTCAGGYYACCDCTGMECTCVKN